MPTGGLMQLVAYGAQDIYLTNNPQITFFQGNYRRHTSFAMEEIDYNTMQIDNLFNNSHIQKSKIEKLLHKNMMMPLLLINNKFNNEFYDGENFCSED